MITNDLILLRRKEIVGTIAIAAWGLFFLLLLPGLHNWEGLGVLSFLVGWIFTIYWVALDARFRGAPVAGWTLFSIVALPLALLFYFISRPPAPALCTACGASLAGPVQACPVCGRQTSAINRIFAGLTDSLAPGSMERARHTAKYMALTFIVLLLVEWAIHDLLPPWLKGFGGFLAVLSFAAYWVLVPWWVYLDATYRRMEAVPWALLALLTNVFGLVTYLVIRYPDPSACPKCGNALTAGLKICPYCGSEAERTCPKCRASVKPDWVYCPSCAAQLPARQDMTAPPGEIAPAMVSAAGTVTDAVTGKPIPGAEVRIDSKGDGKTATTDAIGRFVLADLEPRPYVLLASADGYGQEARACKPGADGSWQIHFSLYPVGDSTDIAAPESPDSQERSSAG